MEGVEGTLQYMLYSSERLELHLRYLLQKGFRPGADEPGHNLSDLGNNDGEHSTRADSCYESATQSESDVNSTTD